MLPAPLGQPSSSSSHAKGYNFPLMAAPQDPRLGGLDSRQSQMTMEPRTYLPDNQQQVDIMGLPNVLQHVLYIMPVMA